MHALIEADGLTKRFGKVQALTELTLTLPSGQPVAILGPNGAGKTTFIRMVATLIAPDRGTLVVNGHDVVRDPMAVRRMIGLAGQSAAVEEMMTGRENLVMVARLYGQGRAEAAASVHIASSSRWIWSRPPTARSGPIPAACAGGSTSGRAWSARPACCCSTSRRRASTPGSRNEVWDAVRDMSRDGTDIVLTTQYLDEADHLAAYIVIIDGGRVIAQGTPDELEVRVSAPTWSSCTRSTSPTMQRAAEVLGALGHGRAGHRPGDAPLLHRRAGRRPLLPVVVRALDEAEVPVEDIALRRPTLDEVFLALTDHSTGTTTTRHRQSQGGRSMTMDLTLDPPRQADAGAGGRRSTAGPRISSPRRARWRRGRSRSSSARRRCIIAGTAQGVLFLLIFRYVFGGAVAHTGTLDYVDFLVPGLRRDRRALPGHGCGQRRGRRPGGRPLRPAAQPAHPAALHRHRPRRRRLRARGLGRARHDGGRLRRRVPPRRARPSTRWPRWA